MHQNCIIFASKLHQSCIILLLKLFHLFLTNLILFTNPAPDSLLLYFVEKSYIHFSRRPYMLFLYFIISCFCLSIIERCSSSMYCTVFFSVQRVPSKTCPSPSPHSDKLHSIPFLFSPFPFVRP